MDLRSWPIRVVMWLASWAPLLVVVFGPDSWSVWEHLAVVAGIEIALFLLVLGTAVVGLVRTGREPDFAAGPSDKGWPKARAPSVSEPSSHVRTIAPGAPAYPSDDWRTGTSR